MQRKTIKAATTTRIMTIIQDSIGKGALFISCAEKIAPLGRALLSLQVSTLLGFWCSVLIKSIEHDVLTLCGLSHDSWWGGGVCVCVCQDLICIPEDSDARGPQIIFSEIWALCSLQIQEHFLPSWIMCSSTQHFWFISPLLDNGQPLRVLEGKRYEARIRHTNTNNNLAASRG